MPPRQVGPCWIIDNGVYPFRIRRHAEPFDPPRRFDRAPHWIGGMRVRPTDP